VNHSLTAGAAAAEITPQKSMFLFGYPHVPRHSTGVHDPLWSTALYLADGRMEAMFIANDIIFISKASAGRVRRRIQADIGVPAANVMVSATHTHSGPITVDYISNEADAIVPKADPEYLRFFESQMVAVAVAARRAAEPAQVGLALGDSTGVGTNRRDPAGPADHQVPVLLVRSADGGRNLAAMVVCSMHPTVLHEDSTLISGDFPGLARIHLQHSCLGGDCPVLLHTGPAGNQSPRHVTKGNTFEEADRLGQVLARAVEAALPHVRWADDPALWCESEFLDLPRRTFAGVDEAEETLALVRKRLDDLRAAGAPRQEVRTAECDWFGAEETLTLARAAADGRLDAATKTCLPAEVQVIAVGPWAFAGWPGEVFVDYALQVKARSDNAFVISLANGELQGYIVTEAAADEGGYEASNALFAPAAGGMLAEKTVEILSRRRQDRTR